MKKFKGMFLITILLFIMLNTTVLAEAATNGLSVKRLNGEGRIETSIEISKEAFKSSKTAIIVGFNGEVDALTGTMLAEEKDAPILISYKNRLDKSLVNELKRLGVEDIYIIGGTSVVEESVEKDLKGLGLNVRRIKGKSREETAISVSKEVIKTDVSEAFLTLGYGVYADALAIGPIAANKKLPLLLTKQEKMNKDTLEFLKESNIRTVTIIGGENAVSTKVENDLKGMGIIVKRIKGNGREETAVNIAKEYIKNPDKIIVANGYKYADAVIGGYLGAKENAPILLNNDKKLKDINREYIEEKRLNTTILGGSTSINDNVLKDIKVGLGIIKDNTPAEPPVPIDPPIPSNPFSLKELKLSMKRELESLKSDITIKFIGSVNTDEVREIIRDIYNDGSYIGGAIKSITPRVIKNGDNSDVVLSAQYYNTKEEEVFIDAEVNRILKNIIEPNMNEFQKVKAVHDYVVNNTVYSGDTIKTSHSAYAALTEGKAVCQGYALLTYRFLDALNIENHYVIGDTLGKEGWGLHAWNLVKIDGKYYNLDTTKDDPVVSDGNDILSYRYFLLSDKRFSETHRVNRDIFPKATDTKYEILSNAYNPFEYDDGLYFGNVNDDNKLYSISLNDLKLKKIADIRAPYVVVNKNKIYFSNYSHGGYIFSLDMNGKNLQQLNKVHSTHLKLESSHIKFFNEATKKWDKLDIRK